MTRRQIYFIADGFQALDLFGPLDAFMEVNSFVTDAYSSQLLGLEKGSVKTAYGQHVEAELGLDDRFECDDLIICGGSGMRTMSFSGPQLKRLREIALDANRVFSICTGAFVLAKLFPFEKMTMTSHWRHCSDLARQYPNTRVTSEPLFIRDDNKWSSAGVLSGVDLALAIIRLDHGNVTAASVAKELVVYAQRAGSQNQFSDMLQVQSSESLKLVPLLDWLVENVHQQLTVSNMAEFLCLSERQLTRLFKEHLDSTPGNYFKRLKLHYARDLLSSENTSIEQVALKVGFNSYDSFRRAFQNHFSMSPSALSKGINS